MTIAGPATVTPVDAAAAASSMGRTAKHLAGGGGGGFTRVSFVPDLERLGAAWAAGDGSHKISDGDLAALHRWGAPSRIPQLLGAKKKQRPRCCFQATA